jgi:hypothetical protein
MPTVLSLLIFFTPRLYRSAPNPTGAELPFTLPADWIVRWPEPPLEMPPPAVGVS